MPSTVKILHGPCMLTIEMRKARMQLGNETVHDVLNRSGTGQALRSKGKKCFTKVR